MSGNGGMGGMPGSKKNKDMNAYKKGGKVTGSKEDASLKDNWPNVGPKKARGMNKAVKGGDFRDNMVKKSS